LCPLRLGAKLAKIASDLGVQEVYVFGSRAKEIAARFRGFSSEEPPSSVEGADVDVGVRPRQRVRLGASQRVALALALEQLLQVGRLDPAIVADEELYEICTKQVEDLEHTLGLLLDWIQAHSDP